MGYLYHTLTNKPTFNIHHFILLLLCLHILHQSATVTGQKEGDGVIIALSDFQALLAIKHELIDLRDTLNSWNGTRNGACAGSWAGIKCVQGHVIAIQLPFKALSGRISSKVGLLKQLRRLSLHDNLIGGTIPSSIGSLPNLRGLYLFNNHLTGSIPPSVGKCLQLQVIDLSNNDLNGFIPMSLVNSPRIHRLNLSSNSLSGSIPSRFALSSSLTFLSLEHNNLSGPIPELWSSYRLRSLTLDFNFLTGTIPHYLGKLGNLETLSLSHNRVNGTIPHEMSNLLRLGVLDLSNNSINGPIPSSISNLSSIKIIDLSHNSFTGQIPPSLDHLSNLTSFNVSYNNLSGHVPSHLLKKFNSSSFVGNIQLCGFTGSTPCPAPPPLSQGPPSHEAKPHHHRKLRTKDIILVVVGGLLAILLVLCCVLLCCLIRKKAGSKSKNGRTDKGVAIEEGSGAETGPTGGKLVLFDGPFVFTADDLLCATAEVMGKTPYGTIYQAILEDGNQVAVKRLRERLAKSCKEFQIEVAELGRIRHPNILPLRAYYLGPKGEKLLVFDYLSNGSLSSFLHAQGPQISINWATRLKIIIGTTSGLNHLHSQENLIHGNLTSSDIFLDEKNNPKISNYGIHRLITDTANTNVISTAGSTGYHAPELQKTKKATMKTDIYSLGMIILEILTGKSPSEEINGLKLSQWVASTVKEEQTNQVFDLELSKDVSASTSKWDEMIKTLKLAMHLVDSSPDARPDTQHILQQLVAINPKLAAETTY